MSLSVTTARTKIESIHKLAKELNIPHKTARNLFYKINKIDNIENIRVNIIVEAMVDGRGEYAWTSKLLQMIEDMGFKKKYINVIFITQLSFMHIPGVLDKRDSTPGFVLSNIIGKVNSACETPINMDDGKTYLILDRRKKDMLETNKEALLEQMNQTFNTGTEIEDGNGINMTLVENVLKFIQQATEVSVEGLNSKDYFSCEINPTDLWEIVNPYGIRDLGLYKVMKFMTDAYAYEADGVKFFHYDITDTSAGHAEAMNKKIFDKKLGTRKHCSIKSLASDETAINIYFATQDVIDPTEVLGCDNFIFMREGGHTNGPNTINAGLGAQSHGIQNLSVKEDESALVTFLNTINPSINLTNYHACYISTGGKKMLDRKKLAIFLAILKQKYDSARGLDVYCLIQDMLFGKGILDDSAKVDIEHNCNLNGPPANLDIAVNKKSAILTLNNGTKIIILGYPPIRGTDRFNFPYFYKRSRDFVMTSGDSSYQEALALGKKVIHIYMGNKADMIGDTIKQLNKLRAKNGNSVIRSLEDASIMSLHQKVMLNIDRTKPNYPSDAEIRQYIADYYTLLSDDASIGQLADHINTFNFDHFLRIEIARKMPQFNAEFARYDSTVSRSLSTSTLADAVAVIYSLPVDYRGVPDDAQGGGYNRFIKIYSNLKKLKSFNFY